MKTIHIIAYLVLFSTVVFLSHRLWNSNNSLQNSEYDVGTYNTKEAIVAADLVFIKGIIERSKHHDTGQMGVLKLMAESKIDIIHSEESSYMDVIDSKDSYRRAYSFVVEWLSKAQEKQ